MADVNKLVVGGASYNIADAYATDKIISAYRTDAFYVRKYKSGIIEYFMLTTKTCETWQEWYGVYSTEDFASLTMPIPLKSIYLCEQSIYAINSNTLITGHGSLIKNSNGYYDKTPTVCGVRPSSIGGPLGKTLVASCHIVGVP